MSPRAYRPWFVCLLATACSGGSGSRTSHRPGLDDSGSECDAWAWGNPTALPLPEDAPTGAFAQVERVAADCDAGHPLVWLYDLTGDDLPDLVELQDCDDETVGVDAWRVWAGTGDGFAPAVDWALPSGSPAGTFMDTARMSTDCDAGYPAWFVDELTGDGIPDLVVTGSCTDATLGDTEWAVYPGGAAGFGAETRWALPTIAGTGAWVTPRVESECGAGSNLPAWGVSDLDGDGDKDIVVTASCVAAEVGVLRWDLYRADHTTFAAAAAWAIPSEVGANVLGRATNQCGEGRPAYFLTDLDPLPGPELVVPLACTAIGSDWTIYPNGAHGFGEPQRFSAPYGVPPSLNSPEHDEASCTTSTPAWFLGDLDGDDRADLTITASCAESAVGEAWWAYAPGSADGLRPFSSIELPAGYSAGTFETTHGTEGSCAGAGNRPAWLRRDLDGDGASELIVTSSCTDDAVGASAWLVYPLTCAAD